MNTLGLLEAMQSHKSQKEMILYWDIETLMYNKIEGKKFPSNYKNVTYSLAIGWNDRGHIDIEVFDGFQSFFDTFIKYSKRADTISPSKTTITMIAHNCNKYDNHFLLHDLTYFYDFERRNLYMKSASDNIDTIKMKEATRDARHKNIILEKRVKSSINLDLIFFFQRYKFNVIDNFMKTTTSIDTLGKKLKDLGFVNEDELKTEFDYNIFDIDDDMTEATSYKYAKRCFQSLNDEQMTYIRNDIIILGQSHIHYSDLFPNFDYSKMTFSVNILNSYLTNDLTSFQLINSFQDEKLQYTDYQFFNMNLYDYIKSFYRGGLNMYNDQYLDKTVEHAFSIDINSSYPYVMYHNKIPTYISHYDSFNHEKKVPTNLDNEDQFTLYKCDKKSFNVDVLLDIKSRVIKQMLVKYYNNDKDYININTNTLRMIRDLTGLDMSEIYCYSYITFNCEYFGARDVIFDNYYIKTQGKQKNIVKMSSPYDYIITDEINQTPYSQEEINLSKVVLNGLYGIPALRSHFNLFRLDENDNLYNVINGYKNSERNILFSTYVTSQAIYNLLQPLSYLTQEQIDDAFIYCDTDSLYLKYKVKHLLPDDMFDPISLGKWDIENEYIDKIHVLNHKKYTYLADNKIKVRSAGIPQNAFDTSLDFDDFVKQHFTDGVSIINQKSIYNRQGTISIYPMSTDIDKGIPYHQYFNDEMNEQRLKIFQDIRKHYDPFNDDDILYIESAIGSFSMSDIFPYVHTTENTDTIYVLKKIHQFIKAQI